MSLPAITTSPYPLQLHRGVPFEAPTSAAAEAATSTGSMSTLYQQYCKEEGCRVNSAFVDYILDRGDTCCLTTLTLRDNYLGPKGLRPVIRLIADCQTLIRVELGGNGATNDTVEFLCAVAEQHLSLSAISLRDSPITVLGCRRLLELLEANPRIIDVDVTGSDILPALQERLRVAAELNRLRVEQTAPQLVAAALYCEAPERGITAEEERQRDAAYSSKKLQSATLQPLTASTRTMTPTPPPPPMLTAAPPEGSAALQGRSDGTPGRLRAPAAGPRLPPAQLDALRARYADRARLFTAINGSDASKAAYAARAELAAMEAHTAPVQAPRIAQPRALDAITGATTPANETAALDGPSSPRALGQPGEEEAGAAEVCEGAATSAVVEVGSHILTDTDRTRGGAVESQDAFVPVRRETAEGNGSGTAGALVERASPPQHTPRPPTPPPRSPAEMAHVRAVGGALLLSKEEQFQLLFDEGCREYSNKNLDAAYVAWNEALDIANEKRNREWIAVVSTNLQRLSYELLVDEGVAQLERGELQDAAKSFTYAMDIAVKARNAAWESAMQQALKRVQSAVFHRGHQSAMKLLEQAIEIKKKQQRSEQPKPSATTTEGAPASEEAAENEAADSATTAVATEFVIPGTDLVVQHTQAFLQEWSSMLLVRDAVATWAESMRVARRIDGGEGVALRDTVDAALTRVAAFLAQYHLDTEMETAGLARQGASRYHYYEGVLLSELWRELLAHVDQTLKHPLLGTVVGLHLGNLYMAANQLPLAEQQFHFAVITSGKVLSDPLLEATGAYYSAVLGCQRAMYSEAESQLLFALRKCEEAEAEEGSHAASGGTSESHGEVTESEDSPDGQGDEGCATAAAPSAADSPRSSGHSRLPRSAVPAGFTQTLKASCNVLLVLALVRTYRYREALERLEHTHAYHYKDILTDKMRATYFTGGLTSLDEIAAISAQVHSTLVYYLPAPRFTWDANLNTFTMQESLYTWVVPQTNDMRFVEVNITKDFNTTLGELIGTVRAGLLLEPEGPVANGSDGSASGMITTLHRQAWMQPLQTLYAILMDPIVDFVQAMSPVPRSGSSLVTVVPAGSVWAVPFHALMSPKTEKFLVESMAVQLCFSATQAAFAALSAQRVQQRLSAYRDVVVVPGEALLPAVAAGLPLAFPLDTHRGQAEGDDIVNALRKSKEARAREAAVADPTATLMARSELLLSDLRAMEKAMPKARTIYFATPATVAPPFTTGPASLARRHIDISNSAALCVPVSHKAVGMLSARQISHMELFAELVVLSNANMAYAYVANGSTQDHTLRLVRGFLSGGVPCVLTGLWCTPDMKPSTLFTRFYDTLYNSGARRLMTRKSVRNDTHHTEHLFASSGGEAGGATVENGAKDEEEEEEEGERHKAVCLAETIRALFHEDPSLRYAPRLWAGYYCVGCDYL